ERNQLLVGEELNLPARDAAAAFRRDLDRANVTRRGNSGRRRVAIRRGRLVHRLEALDDFSAVARGEPAKLTNSCADQAVARDQWMPPEAELADQRPHRVLVRR